jgi:hypothetical protein
MVAVHSTQTWVYALGIYKIPNIQIVISPKTRDTSYREHVLLLLVCTTVVGKNSFFNKTGNARIHVTLRCLCVTIVAVEKQYALHILSLYLSVALITQHAMRMCYLTLSSVACLVLLYFSTLSNKR